MKFEDEYIEAMKAIEIMSEEYKKILESKEFLLGKKILKFKYYLKHFKFITLIKKIYNSTIKKQVYKIDNLNNDIIFKNNSDNFIDDYNKNEKIAVYTVNIGGYDQLIQPLIKPENVDFYIVSDKKPDILGKWMWIDANEYISELNVSNVKKARYIKTHPHLIFKNYKYSIFIDGNICCISDITQFISRINKKTKIAIHPHPYRDCIYKELVALKITGKGDYKTMYNQIREYELEGMPHNYGLFETNVFIREHNNQKCIDIMEKWWNEIKEKSERDQLSFTYVLWKNGYVANDIGVIYDSIKNNPVVQVVNHIEIYDK